MRWRIQQQNTTTMRLPQERKTEQKMIMISTGIEWDGSSWLEPSGVHRWRIFGTDSFRLAWFPVRRLPNESSRGFFLINSARHPSLLRPLWDCCGSSKANNRPPLKMIWSRQDPRWSRPIGNYGSPPWVWCSVSFHSNFKSFIPILSDWYGLSIWVTRLRGCRRRRRRRRSRHHRPNPKLKL